MANFKINLEQYSTPTSIVIITGLFLLALSCLTGWMLYYWYVVAYGFNLVVAPMFSIPNINIWVAGALVTFVGAFFSDVRHKVYNMGAKTRWTYFLSPFVAHFMIWLLVG